MSHDAQIALIYFGFGFIVAVITLVVIVFAVVSSYADQLDAEEALAS